MAKNRFTPFVLILAMLASSVDAHAQVVPAPPTVGDGPAASSKPSRNQRKFARVAEAIGERILLTDSSGIVRDGVLADMTADALTMRFGATTQTFAREKVASAERLKDPTSDGVAKGVLLGLLSVGDQTMGHYLTGIALFGALGFILDAGETHRQTLYRAPWFTPAPQPSTAVAETAALTLPPTIKLRQ